MEEVNQIEAIDIEKKKIKSKRSFGPFWTKNTHTFTYSFIKKVLSTYYIQGQSRYVNNVY